jgi:hypothetical protein
MVASFVGSEIEMRVGGLAVAALMTLAGCQTKPIEQMSYTEVRQLAGEIAKRCNDQGVKGPSREFSACTQQEITREASLRQENAERRQRVGAALSQAGQNYNRSVQANRPVNCTSNMMGNSVSTTCY